jgi:hypothetical protein
MYGMAATLVWIYDNHGGALSGDYGIRWDIIGNKQTDVFVCVKEKDPEYRFTQEHAIALLGIRDFDHLEWLYENQQALIIAMTLFLTPNSNFTCLP